MSSRRPTSDRAHRYARFVDRRRWLILALGLVVAAITAPLAAGLPLKTDLAQLLPPSEPSVRDLHELEHRTRSIGAVIAAVASADPALRSRAAHLLAERIRAIGPRLVGTVTVDDGEARRYAWQHRFLYAPLADLEQARDGIKERVKAAKLEANPLYIDLDDEDAPDGAPAAASGPDQAAKDATDAKLHGLRQRLREAEAKVDHPDQIVAKDGKLQLVIVHAPFPSSNVGLGEELVKKLELACADVRREVGPGVDLGLADDIVTGVAEQEAILHGMLLAIILTTTVVGLSLLLFCRSGWAVGGLLWSLAVGTVATFGLARLSIGYLNSASAFLSAIVVGNGINSGVIVLARYLEERRRGHDLDGALAAALGGSFVGTLSASLASGIAYASLLVTRFRGFRDFGVIGGTGMVLCWLSSYTILPAALAVLERAKKITPRREPALGRLLAWMLPRRLGWVAAVGGVMAVLSGGLAWHYLSSDPFEYEWDHLRADSAPAMKARDWMHRIDLAFGHGLASGFAVAVDHPGDAAKVEQILRSHEERPGRPGLFRSVGTIADALPSDQAAKLPVLAELRGLLLDKKTIDALSDEERADVARVTPPAGITTLGPQDIPEALVPQFVEQDGSRGKLLFADQAQRFNGWNGRDMLVFSDAVRQLRFPPGTHLGGSAFVFADILRAVGRDGPRATLASLAGVILFVFLVVGFGRHAVITVVCAVVGTSAMLAAAWLLGLKVNFLDFVALPITLGISVDYSVNIVTRARVEGVRPHAAIATTGGAVVLCSWTTIVGYGSLLLSANSGIRSFGLAAILGEITCLVAALTLAPALLELFATRQSSTLPPRASAS